MGVIDPRRYAQLKPLFLAALSSRTWPGDDARTSLQAVVRHLAEAGYGRDEIDAVRSYVMFFLEEVRLGVVDPLMSPAALPGYPGAVPRPVQPDLFAFAETSRNETERALIDQLISATRLYDSQEAVRELMEFTIRLREFAPFNGMLLHIQKPGLTHAASASDWWNRFGRVPKMGARPLLILRMKGPVDFVFDVQDTEGHALPDGAFSFPTFGALKEDEFSWLISSIKKERIVITQLDAGDAQAGWIRLLEKSKSEKGKNLYELAYNKNHPVPTRFVTVAHELGHLFLGHLGEDRGRRIADRRSTSLALMEVEAEMAAYLVARRNGLQPRSESYLAKYQGAFGDINLYAITRAANAVEAAMGISAAHLWNR
ncbi:hypothetical protein N825_20685 [Skermanella stibiiresistens SB22]|uniref:IrrE N-terminal-like domain-containing protein n=1 Tax=Skermanella stibiiresistens SB22 TaxID=1385369 RepID=W9GTT1_9PROT|nr:ImmA/IrrE family metallo-endopeptidase [Skermanella stibiiresistens]EWY37305.1 hypothetical protein N825_20685 [Skermanella stibiiresistens SB22]